MNDEIRAWLDDTLSSWLTTWEGDEEDPEFLRTIIGSLRHNNSPKLTREALEEIIFHLYQKFSDPETETEFPLTYIDRAEVDSYGGQDLELEDVAEKMMKSEALMECYWLAMEHAVKSLKGED